MRKTIVNCVPGPYSNLSESSVYGSDIYTSDFFSRRREPEQNKAVGHLMCYAYGNMWGAMSVAACLKGQQTQ